MSVIGGANPSAREGKAVADTFVGRDACPGRGHCARRISSGQRSARSLSRRPVQGLARHGARGAARLV